MEKATSLSYKDSGVDIDAGNALVEQIKGAVKQTKRPEVMGGLGGFGALCAIPAKYRQPILVSGTDGVGTKLRLAIDLARHHDIGIDLVAMCVNDLLVQGAEPLFFLDYYATAKLDVTIAKTVIEGIARGCLLANCALVGGETAEMPGMYQQDDYDLAGFCVGVVEKDQLIDGSKIKAGDALIGLASSGPHANGYSLIRKIIADNQIDIQSTQLAGKPLSDWLLAPTRIYVASLLPLLTQGAIHGLCHITGGGFWENIPRILPTALQAQIQQQQWQWPAIFQWLAEMGNITPHEMYRTFNCGIGMVLVVDQQHSQALIQQLNQLGEHAFLMGQIAEKSAADQPSVVIE